MKNIFIGESLYTLLIFLLLEKKDETFFFLGSNINIKNIKNKKILKKFRFKNKILKFLDIYLKEKYIKYFCKKNKIDNLKVFGADHLSYSNYFKKNHTFYVIEDGISNYKINNYQQKNKILKKYMGLISSYGNNKKTSKIYLTGLSSIPQEIYNKVEIIDLKKLWMLKTLKEQYEILDIFSFDLDIKERIKGRDIILFTQPLSEDKIITEEEKVEIYSKIIKKYSTDRLIIKTHPREKTDYKNIFKEYLVLDNSFPFEILNLLDIKLKKAITIFSTAALGLGKEVEVDFYGTEIHPKILKRFGSCDNIMKRNCFLEEE